VHLQASLGHIHSLYSLICKFQVVAPVVQGPSSPSTSPVPFDLSECHVSYPSCSQFLHVQTLSQALPSLEVYKVPVVIVLLVVHRLPMEMQATGEGRTSRLLNSAAGLIRSDHPNMLPSYSLSSVLALHGI